MSKLKLIILLAATFLAGLAFADNSGILETDVFDDDMTIGGDIFSDFNEDIDVSQVAEHERYYRYGRFFTFLLCLGITSFAGNRGAAYEPQNPSYSVSFTFFQDFQIAYTLGFGYSKHSFFVGYRTDHYNGLNDEGAPGMIDVRMLRAFFGVRHYFDTSNLGTAITYSNPYLTGRLEYWYTTNKFIDQSSIPNNSGGGLGVGVGGGLEFPIKLRESYIGLEVLFHTVNFFDKYTQEFRPPANNANGNGFDDLTGNAFTTMVSYIINW